MHDFLLKLLAELLTIILLIFTLASVWFLLDLLAKFPNLAMAKFYS